VGAIGAAGPTGAAGPSGPALEGALAVGRSETGVWSVDSPSLELQPVYATANISFPIPLAVAPEAPDVQYVEAGKSPLAGGCAGGSVGDPTAAAGYLCVYAGVELLENAVPSGIESPKGVEGAGKAGATVYFRAKNTGAASVKAQGTWAVGGSGAPSVVTGPASPVGMTTATVGGTVAPNGRAVEEGECKIEYGTAIPYTSVPCSPEELPGSTIGAVPVSAELHGLTENTTYHFRVSATNAGGTSVGLDETFKTQ
jgi:hypothetical protein